MSQSWTYFVQAENGGPIKIGITSTNPSQRLAGLQTGSPLLLQFVGLINGDCEKKLHDQFRSARLHGEWFEPVPELIEFIQKHGNAELLRHDVQEKQIEIQGAKLAVHQVGIKDVGFAYFDHVYENNDDLWEKMVYGHPWPDADEIVNDGNEDQEEEDQADEDEIRSVSDAIDHFCFTVQDERFVEYVGVNFDAGMIGFICGPCNSDRRFELLRVLAGIAFDLDYIDGSWFCFAMFWDGPKHIGINLVLLALDQDKSGRYIFDPENMGVTVVGDDQQ